MSKKWIRPQIQELAAYHVSEPGNAVKLDAMENPYTWDEAVTDALLKVLRKVPLNRYPHPSPPVLKQLLRETMQVPQDMRIILGNGSDEIIQMLALAVGGENRSLLAPEPGFVMYRMLSLASGLNYVGVPLRAPDFALDLPAMLAAIEQYQPALVFIAYPNNPTGNLFKREEVEEIIRAAPGAVVVDEAYCAFAGDSFMPMLGQYDNLLVMRTVSKIGLAGLRLGMLAGPAAWLDELDKVRLPYNINSLTQACAEFALRRYDMLSAQTAKIRADRSRLFEALQKLPDVLKVWPSEANFLLLRVTDAPQVFARLKQNGVLIKSLHGSHPLLEHCLRVTVGTAEENRLLLEAFA